MKDGSQMNTSTTTPKPPRNIPFPSEFRPQSKKTRTKEQQAADTALEDTFRRAVEEL